MKPTIILSFRPAILLAGMCLAAGMAPAASNHENNLEKTFQVTPGARLVLDADGGSCDLKLVDGDSVQVRVFREVKGGNQAQADQLFTNHVVTFQQEGNTVSIVAKNKARLSWSWRFNQPHLEVHFQVSIPKKCDVDLKTAGGDLHLGEVDGAVKALTSSGGIVLKRAAGAVDAADSGGDIIIENAEAALTAHTSSGSIRVQKAQGDVEAANSGGDIVIDDAGRAVAARTSSGTIRLKWIKGDVHASDSGGDIMAERVGGSVDAATSSGSINLGQIQGSVQARNSGGDIGVESASGSVVARTSSGAIRIKAVQGAVQAKNSGGDVSIDHAGSAVDAQTSSGAIKIGTAQGSVEAKDSGGDVTINEALGAVRAQTSSGAIHLKLAKGKVEARDSGGSIQVSEARAAVQASTSSGDITVGWVTQPSEDCRLEVSGGSINLSLPPSAALTLDARSSGGKVQSELPVTMEGGVRSGVLQGKINGGGPSLVLRSSSGDIEIKSAKTTLPAAEAEEVPR